MSDVTVTCGCGRKMTQRGNDPKGTLTCGCGARVRIEITERPQCVWSNCQTAPVRESEALGLLLCATHLAELGQLFESLHTAELERRQLALDHQEADLANREIYVGLGLQQWDARWERSHEAHVKLRKERLAGAPWQVYYMRIGDCIKIGSTRDLKQRITALQPDEVLALEPGDIKVERERQHQFAHLRVRGERFRPGPDLLAHIQFIREGSAA